jgi:DNA-binding response OmpR family regulator
MALGSTNHDRDPIPLGQVLSMIRILVLEDHDQMRQALVEALEDEGYEVAVATRGEEAVEKARKAPFDLLITDIRMEGMDGLEALRHVREQQPGIHSMVVTGYSTEDDSIRAIRLGAGDYLKKPFKLNDFLKRVNRLVADRLRQLDDVAAEDKLRETCLRLGWGLGKALNPTALRAGTLCCWMCQQMGRPVHLNFVTTVATSLSELQNVVLPDGVEALKSEAPEAWEEATVDERIVTLSVAAVRAWTEFGSLESLEDSRFEPFLLSLAKVYSWNEPVELESLLETSTFNRARLQQLGQTLERAGDLTGARRAYELLVEQPESSGAVYGCLGLAGLAYRTGDLNEATDKLSSAVAMAQGLGAATLASTLLRAGLLSLNWGISETEPWLKESVEGLAQIGDQASLAEARLALAALGAEWGACEGDLETLMLPENLPRFKSTAGWSTAILLERASDSSCKNALLYLVREVPQALEAALTRSPSKGAKEAALDLVEQTHQSSLEGAVLGLLSEADERLRMRAHRVLNSLRSQGDPPPLIMYFMGSMQVFLGKQLVDETQWKTAKTKYLLAYLVSRGGLPVADERLVEMFWPGPIQKGKRSLNTAISNLRKTLRPENWEGELDYFIRGAGKVQFNTAHAFWCDRLELEKAAKEARRLEGLELETDAVEHHARVCQLYRGAFLQECYLDWTDGPRVQLEQQAIGSLNKVAHHALATNQAERALEGGLRLVELNPCEEQGYRLAMQAYLALERHSQAVRLYHECEKTLKSELDMEPSIDLFRLHQMALMSQSSSSIG